MATGSPPAGLTLAASTGILSGTPSTPGSSTFTVRVSDSQSTPGSATKEFTLAIQPAPLAITTASTLPQGVVGTAYSRTLAATGGIPPYTWSVTDGIATRRTDAGRFDGDSQRNAVNSREFHIHNPGQ